MSLQLTALSAASPTGLYLLFVGIMLLVVAVFVVVALLIRRSHRRAVAVVALAVLIVASAAYVVWSTGPTIEYWLMTNQTYSATGNDAVTVKCRNTGQLAATFSLNLEFGNAAFSTQTSQPFTQLNGETVQFTFTLQPGETQSTLVCFTIDRNATDFYLDLSFQQSGGNFLVKAEPGGVTSTSYQVDTATYQVDTGTGNFTQRTYLPPP
jgi:hypothetical protein